MELVGYEDDEARSTEVLASCVVHKTINELLKEGRTTDEIVEIKGCCKSSVNTARYQLKKQNEIHKEKDPLQSQDEADEIDIGKVGALWIAGWDIHKIADEMGVEDEEIEEIVRKQ